jgi:hypothetical protein
LPVETSIGLVPASAARDASLLIRMGSGARDEELGGADRSDPTLFEQSGCYLGGERSECTLGVGDLSRESLDAFAEPTEHAVHHLGARSQASRRLGESLPRERSTCSAAVTASALAG